jgi:DNA-directed RNA polymerase specialized sigma24 family protein
MAVATPTRSAQDSHERSTRGDARGLPETRGSSQRRNLHRRDDALADRLRGAPSRCFLDDGAHPAAPASRRSHGVRVGSGPRVGLESVAAHVVSDDLGPHDVLALKDRVARAADFVARGPGSRGEKDAILRALLAWAKTEPLGARIVLEVIRPGLLNLSARLLRNARDKEELRSIVLLSAWEVPPLPAGAPAQPSRGEPPARHAQSDAHRTRARERMERDSLFRHGRGRGEQRAGGDRPRRRRSARKSDSGGAPPEAEVILTSRFDGTDLAELARGAGVSYNAIKMRRQRAERRLIVFLGYRPVPRGQQAGP